MNIYLSIGAGDHDREARPGPRHQGPGAPRAGPGRLLHQPRPLLRLHVLQVVDTLSSSAANRIIGEVVQSRRRPLPGPSPG